MYVRTTSGPKLMSLGPCIEVPFGTRTTKIAEFRFVVGPRWNRMIGSRGFRMRDSHASKAATGKDPMYFQSLAMQRAPAWLVQ